MEDAPALTQALARAQMARRDAAAREKNARKRKALGTRRREHDVLVATKPLFSHEVESAFETKRDSFNARTLTMMRKGKTS